MEARIKVKFGIVAILIILALGAAYYYLSYRPHHRPVLETDYVISPSLDVLSTYAPVHSVLEVLKAGDPARVIRHSREWDEIVLADGRTGWVLASQLIGPKIFEAGKKLLNRVSQEQVQASGHTSDVVNLHVAPSRQGALLSVLSPDEKLEMFDREMVARESPGASAAGASASSSKKEAWYLVRTESQPVRAGWVLGRLISLDIPAAISQYAQAYNLVAWRPLAYVDDNGQRIPEYVAVDRVGPGEEDFNHLRVFTWSTAHQDYATAFVESGLNGAFPVTVGQQGTVPYFCLRLTDKHGEKFEKFYGLFNTVVRPMGIVQGWPANATPPAASAEAHRRRRRQ